MTSKQPSSSLSIAKVIYILLIISTIVGITGIIAVIMAYVNKNNSIESADHWLQTHYRFQIRTYWIGLLYVFIGAITLQLTIGFFILVFTFFWIIIRCAKGLKQLENKQEVQNINSWMFT